MVYRGRPSTGCSRCRTRKIKCDERPGGCVKCAEKGFTCPGYDRTVDAFFLDETAKVKSKAKLSNAKAMAARESRDNQELALLVRSDSPSVHLIAPLLDQGLNFFLKHNTVGLDQPPVSSKAYHQHLSTDGFHPLVATTMTALGIAGVANLYKDPRLEKEAMRWYLNAIKMANAAISSPEEVRKDTTLISVNLLSFFEATFNDSSLMGWSNHVDGAAMLVKMRGQGQFQTPAGRRMYLHTIAMLTMNCMGKGIAMPDYVRDLNDEIMGYLDSEDPRNAFFFLHIKANNLRAEIFKNKDMDLRDIVDRALELDIIAASIFKDIGKEWRYDIVPKSGNIPQIYGDSYHVYPSHPAAQTWNWVRYNRIYFHDIIRNCILAGLTRSPPVLTGAKYLQLIEKSTQTLQQMQSDILASMPQFLHDTPKVAPRMMVQTGTIDPTNIPIAEYYQDPVNSILLSPPDTPRSHNSYYPSPTPDPNPTRKAIYTNFLTDTLEPAMLIDKSTIRDRLPIVRVSGGYSTIWALYVAGSMPTASPQSQDFVLQCFKRIESEFGIKQARVLGNALRLKRRLPNQGEVVGQLCPEYLPPDEPVVPWTPEEGETEAIPHPLARNEGGSAMDEIDAAIYGNTVDDFGQMV